MSTYTPIATQTLGSSAATITFSSLPQNYTDLIIVANGSVSANANMYLQFNGDISSTYSDTRLIGEGIGSASSSRASNATYIRLDGYAFWRTSYSTMNVLQVQNYSNGATFKTALVRSGNGSGGVDAIVGLWRSTSAVTSVTIGAIGGATMSAGSTFTIYGISAGNSSAKASGGNIVTTDGTYWYHAFTSSGTFIPSSALTVDYLVVAGGGGGAIANSGGGGAGGLRSTVTATGGGGSLESALSLSANTVYQAIIGAGGAGGTTGNGIQGNNSTFSTITSTGGARAIQGDSGVTGGSGSGAAGDTTTGGAGTPNQGYAGGNSGQVGNNRYNWGGGGGSGSVGSNGTSTAGGNGGSGVLITALATSTGTGVSGYYAGGGGGGYDNRGSGNTVGTGQAGGGNGSTALANATSATANTGSGGGGAGNGGSGTGLGGSGGSGIVIIRYAV